MGFITFEAYKLMSFPRKREFRQLSILKQAGISGDCIKIYFRVLPWIPWPFRAFVIRSHGTSTTSPL